MFWRTKLGGKSMERSSRFGFCIMLVELMWNLQTSENPFSNPKTNTHVAREVCTCGGGRQGKHLLWLNIGARQSVIVHMICALCRKHPVKGLNVRTSLQLNEHINGTRVVMRGNKRREVSVEMAPIETCSCKQDWENLI